MPFLAQDVGLEHGKSGPEFYLFVGRRHNPYSPQIQLLGASEVGDGPFDLDSGANVDKLAVDGEVELA